jgi:outer membrane protein OmpA-like peptidoglycan-associated protein
LFSKIEPPQYNSFLFQSAYIIASHSVSIGEHEMKSRYLLPLFAVIGLFCVVPSARAQGDTQGSKDHPLISRMPGYYIDSYDVSEFAAFDPTVIGGKEVTWEGKKYKIAYSRKEGATPVSTLQIVRNYEAAIAKIGGKRLGGDERRLAAEIRKGGAVTGVYLEAFNEGRNYDLVIVEMQAMRQDVTADATVMGRELTAAGKTIIYGIYFDTGSAVIKPESEPAIAEMLKLLKANPNLKAFVAGHTDNVGTLEINLKLSADRADALVKALVGRGIEAARLKAAGVGPYSPVASNKDEPGRAQNRRVELVER